jgi:hypothetical protein
VVASLKQETAAVALQQDGTRPGAASETGDGLGGAFTAGRAELSVVASLKQETAEVGLSRTEAGVAPPHRRRPRWALQQDGTRGGVSETGDGRVALQVT